MAWPRAIDCEPAFIKGWCIIANLLTTSCAAIDWVDPIYEETAGIAAPTPTQTVSFSARRKHQVVDFNNWLYLLGGYDGSSKNDILKSPDGQSWTQVTSSAPWSARWGHQVVVFNNELYLLGGHANGSYGSYKNDVWKSADGLNWTQVTSSADWSGRDNHQVVVLNNELYLLGGTDGIYGSYKNDVWKSADGLNWTQVTSSADWSGRDNHQVVVLNNELYLLGGSYFNDVWRSPDGQNWTQ